MLSTDDLSTQLGIKRRTMNGIWKLRTNFLVHSRLVNGLKIKTTLSVKTALDGSTFLIKGNNR